MDTQNQRIAELAYLRWLNRGRPGDTSLEDWLAAESAMFSQNGQSNGPADDSPYASGELLQAILDNIDDAVSVKDLDGRYLLLNSRSELLLGRSLAEVQGKSDHDLFPAPVADAFRRSDLQVLASGQRQEFEQVAPHADGLHTYTVLKVPLFDAAGRPHAVCSIATDISTRKLAEARLAAEHAVTRVLAEAASLEEAAPHILKAICRGLGWDVGLLWKVDPQAQALRCFEIWHMPGIDISTFAEASRQRTFLPGQGVPGRVWASGKPVWITNVVEDDNFPRAPAALADGLRGVVSFPIRDRSAFLGVIEFFSRQIREPDEELLEMMRSIGSQIGQFVERRQAEKVLYQCEREFSLARSIQQRRLPRKAPALPRLLMGGVSVPAQETGGDYFDYVPMEGGRLGIAIGDASGHGIGAALEISETRAYLRAMARHATDPGQVLSQVNQHLGEDMQIDHFVTMFLACLDPTSLQMTFSNAGHWPGYVLNFRGEVKRILCGTGPPLGVDPHAAIPTAPPVILETHDLLVLLTDGILEAADAHGRPYGMDRVLDHVRKHSHLFPEQMVQSLLAAVQAYSSGGQADDRTAVILRVEHSSREWR